MNKTEILNIVNEPSKHIQIVNLDGKVSIVYSAKFVELLELIPTMLTKADMVDMLEELQLEIEELDSRAGYSGDGMPTFSTDYIRKKKVNELIQLKINSLEESNNE